MPWWKKLVLAAGLVIGAARVVWVIDGDTVILADRTHIRLIGINTPEKGKCYYNQATALTKSLLFTKSVTLEKDFNPFDRYGRTPAYIFLPHNQKSVNEELLEKGAGVFFLDTVNVKYQKRLIEAAEIARLKPAGLWKECGPCEIKGNYDIRGHRYYHLPSFRHYSQVVMNLNKGDRWFCSEAAAATAGFTRARE